MKKEKNLPSSVRCITIRVYTTFPSLNNWYAGRHWTDRHKTKKELQSVILQALAKYPELKMKRFTIAYRYHNRFDCDNTIPAIKIFVDTMKVAGVILDDTPKYFTGFSVTFDNALQKSEHVFEITYE
jgi:hypothetical protein